MRNLVKFIFVRLEEGLHKIEEKWRVADINSKTSSSDQNIKILLKKYGGRDEYSTKL